MQVVMQTLRERQAADADRPPVSLAAARAAFVPSDTVHPIPGDVSVREVSAGGVTAHWLDAPGVDSDRVLLFLHGGGYQFGSLRSDGELAARLGRAGGMRVLFPEYRLAPEHPFPAAVDDVLEVWGWLRAALHVSPTLGRGGGDSAGGVSRSPCSSPSAMPGRACPPE